jgi:hypothetical protein
MTDADPPATPLDEALRAMAAAPEDTGARLAFHAELSRAEVFVLLQAEVSGDRMEPRVFDLSQGRAVLAFDSELRLAGFAGQAAYAALPGRVLVAMLAGQGLALMLNADTDHAALLPPEALEWLAETLSAPAPAQGQAVPEGFAPPDLPPAVLERLIPALERRLSGLPGLQGALLAGVRWQGGGRGHVLALSGLPEAAEAPVARAVAEALALSGLEAAALDVVFPPPAALAALAPVARALSPAPFVAPEEQVVTPGAAPGMDPDRPPRLR